MLQRLTCSSTLAARDWGVSCGFTGTIACARMGPVSYCSSTKCTVAPDHLAPEAITALCTLAPYKPFPPNAGSRPGWMFSMAFLYSRTKAAGTSCNQSRALLQCTISAEHAAHFHCVDCGMLQCIKSVGTDVHKCMQRKACEPTPTL